MNEKTELSDDIAAIRHTLMTGLAHNAAIAALNRMGACEGCKPRRLCRDCADNDGTCPNDGKPCDPKARHTCGKYAASPSSKSTEEADPFDALPPEIEGRLSVWLTLGKELHPLTVNLVVRFARALAAKLADAEQKYGYSDGWRSPDWMDECRAHLMEHIGKGDPRDVAAYCAFLWHHGESTALASSSIKEDGERAEPGDPRDDDAYFNGKDGWRNV